MPTAPRKPLQAPTKRSYVLTMLFASIGTGWIGMRGGGVWIGLAAALCGAAIGALVVYADRNNDTC